MTSDPGTSWQVLHVTPPQVVIPFSLTTGLWRVRDHPDLVVFDMPTPAAQRCLDALGERVRAGATLRAGHVLGGLHEQFRFGLVAVEDEEFRAELGRWDVRRRRDPGRPLLQLVWPDLCDTLPWEPGCDLGVGGLRQPLLGRWPSRRTRRSG